MYNNMRYLPPLPKIGKSMNTMKTVANQIETFGKYLRTVDTEAGITVDIYRVDTVTNARICRDKRKSVRMVTFEYAMR